MLYRSIYPVDLFHNVEPSWASINRGVLVCNECCSVHRSLGRHISYIRSLHSTNWPPVLKEVGVATERRGAGGRGKREKGGEGGREYEREGVRERVKGKR